VSSRFTVCVRKAAGKRRARQREGKERKGEGEKEEKGEGKEERKR